MMTQFQKTTESNLNSYLLPIVIINFIINCQTLNFFWKFKFVEQYQAYCFQALQYGLNNFLILIEIASFVVKLFYQILIIINFLFLQVISNKHQSLNLIFFFF